VTSRATLHSAPSNACISAFHLAYDCNSPLPTELYLSQRWRYPFGFNVTVTPQPSCNVTLPQQNAGVSRMCVRHALCLTPPLQCTSCALRVTALKCLCKRARGGSSACSVRKQQECHLALFRSVTRAVSTEALRLTFARTAPENAKL
jgi:hypothetical protein